MMMSPGQPEDKEQVRRSANLTMAFAIGSSVVVVLILIALAIFIFSVARQIENPQESALYAIGDRPVPLSDRIGGIFAKSLGDFTRQKMEGALQDFYIVYSAENSTIDTQIEIEIRGSQAVSVVAAQAGVKSLAARLVVPSAEQYIDDARPRYSYYLAVDSAGARLAYSHDRWFFDIRAPDRAALDAFMAVFPY